MTATTLERAGTVHAMPDHEYHAGPELSSTGARQILDSPAKFQYNLTHPQAHKDAFDVGTCVHTKVLGVGAEIEVLDHDSWRTNAAKADRDQARANGRIPMLKSEFAPIDAMAESVLAHPGARQVLESIEGREVSLFADVEDVRIRARFDIYDGVDAADLKTARDASPKGFNAAVGRLGYHIQDDWYRGAHTAITGTELQSFKFLVVENFAPYLVGVYDLDFMWEDLAKERTRRARAVYRECTSTGEWPGYASTTLTPPTWAIYENTEEEIQV